MAKKVSGWGLFNQKFYDDWEKGPRERIIIVLTIVGGFLLIMLYAAIKRGHLDWLFNMLK